MNNKQPNPKILVVDDMPQNLFAIEKLLTDLDVEIIKTTSGTEALSFTLKHQFALAIVDVQMPEMDGYELVELLHSNYTTQHLPVIFVSAIYSDEYHYLKGYETGAVDFLAKPFKPEILLGKVQVFLALYRQKVKLQELIEELNHKNEVLANEIKHRQLTEIALREAMEKAKLANQAKDNFLANISHEFRTPLNGILGYAQILKRDKDLKDKQKDGLNVIEQNGQHLLTLIEDIIDFSKIESNQVSLFPSSFHLANFLNYMAKTYQLQAERKGLIFSYEPDSNLPTYVQADTKRLQQILLNLLDNAVKFTKQGGITFKVKPLNQIEQTDNPHQKLCFEISDTGIGMSPEQIEQISAPFQQASEILNKTKGIGLGLTLCNRLIEIMKGKLKVQSELGKGSTFQVELVLPIATAANETIKSTQQTIIGYSGATQKILVVDNKSQNRLLLTNFLKPLGFEITEAKNGQEAIMKALNIQPHVILMEMVLPVMSGFEATQKIRQISNLKNTIIIAITSSVLHQDQEQSKLMGCDDFLPKPINAQNLFDVLASHLDIKWTYEPNSINTLIENTNPELTNTETQTKINIPKTNQLLTLLDLAKKGNMKAIRTWSMQLKETNSQYDNFANKIHQLANNYQEQEILILVQQLLKEND